eukprot:207915-Chlamydomonas_euryale.AAC.6
MCDAASGAGTRMLVGAAARSSVVILSPTYCQDQGLSSCVAALTAWHPPAGTFASSSERAYQCKKYRFLQLDQQATIF